MVFKRSIAVVAGCAVLGAGAVLLGAQAAPASKPGGAVKLELPPAPAKAKPLLPEAFAGWVMQGAAQNVTDATATDSANAQALREYQFTHALLATYKRSGETLTVHALGFLDASGAYGAFSFYRKDNWPKADIGTDAASNGNRVVFWVGNTVVDATFSQVGPMSAGELRELVKEIPVPLGNRALTPPILLNLPKPQLDKQTLHYALGVTSYAGAGGVLPPEMIGFDRGAETVTASYGLSSNVATLTLIDYPTPQMAAAREAKFRDYLKAGSHAQPAFPKPLVDSDQASLEVRRTGPLVAIVSGDAIPDESHKLLESVNFQEELVNIPQPTESEVNKTGRLLMGIATLVIIGSAAAILLGLFLGGGRALWRVAHGKPASSVYEVEFIRLNLEK
jgi:hypothetical protein